MMFETHGKPTHTDVALAVSQYVYTDGDTQRPEVYFNDPLEIGDDLWIGPFTSEAGAEQKMADIVDDYQGVEAAARVIANVLAGEIAPSDTSVIHSWGIYHLRRVRD